MSNGQRNGAHRDPNRKPLAASDGHRFDIFDVCCHPVEVELQADGQQQILHDHDCPILTDPTSPESITARIQISRIVCIEAERLGHGHGIALLEITPGGFMAIDKDGPVQLPSTTTGDAR